MKISIKRNHEEKGVAVIEFALVFTLVFAVFWALVSYTFPFILLQAMNRAVAESTRVAANLPTSLSTDDYKASVINVAERELSRQLKQGWLPVKFTNGLTFLSARFETNDGLRVLVVEAKYPNYSANPIIPILSLPGIGQVPKLPQDLVAKVVMVL